jgi:ketosteroid isomerase-like protein
VVIEATAAAGVSLPWMSAAMPEEKGDVASPETAASPPHGEPLRPTVGHQSLRDVQQPIEITNPRLRHVTITEHLLHNAPSCPSRLRLDGLVAGADASTITWQVIDALHSIGEYLKHHKRMKGHVMTTEKITGGTVEELLRRIGEGDHDRIAELFAERIDWQLNWPAGGHSAVPWIRPRSGRADIADHFRMLDAFHVPEKNASSVTKILVDGADAVALGYIGQTVKASGRAYTCAFALHLTVEEGLITRYHIYEDSLTVAEALADEGVHR